MANETKSPPKLPSARQNELQNAIAEELDGGAEATQPIDFGGNDEPLLASAFSSDETAREAHAETKVMKFSPDMLRATNAGVRMSDAVKITPLEPTTHATLRFEDGRRVIIAKPLLILGRVKEVADVVLAEDDQVSRHHAAVMHTNGEFYLEDLESTNGTYVGDDRIHRVKLKHGDTIRVGRHTAIFEIE
jgi:hypothetical protein